MGWGRLALVLLLLWGCNINIPNDISIHHKIEDPSDPPPPDKPDDEVTFKDVQAGLFKARCQSCHNETNPTAGYSVETYASAMKKVVATKPDDSWVYVRVYTDDMPPSPKPKSTNDEKDLLKTWIEQGAKP
jgi:uncharacterized membrane protein